MIHQESFPALPVRKRRWLRWSVCVGLILVLLAGAWVGVHQWRVQAARARYETAVARLRAQGEPVTLAAMRPAAVPSEENAGLLYEEALDELRQVSPDDRERIAALAERWQSLSTAEQAEAQAFLETSANALRLVRMGAPKPACVIPTTPDTASNPSGGLHLTDVRLVSHLLRLSAGLHLASGRLDEPVADAVVLLRFARRFDSVPTLPSLLTKCALESIALQFVRAAMNTGDPSPAPLAKLAELIADSHDRSELVRVMKGERASAIDVRRRQLDDPAAFLDDAETPDTWMNRLYLWYLLPMMIDADLEYLERMAEVIPLAEQPFYLSASRWRSLELQPKPENVQAPFRGFLAAAAWPVMRKGAVAFDHVGTVIDSARLAVALRRHRMKHGKYPATLGALVPEFIGSLPRDPFSGAGYIYRREGEGFVVYGVGRNGVDDGGVDNREDWDKSDIVWECSR